MAAPGRLPNQLPSWFWDGPSATDTLTLLNEAFVDIEQVGRLSLVGSLDAVYDFCLLGAEGKGEVDSKESKSPRRSPQSPVLAPRGGGGKGLAAARAPGPPSAGAATLDSSLRDGPAETLSDSARQLWQDEWRLVIDATHSGDWAISAHLLQARAETDSQGILTLLPLNARVFPYNVPRLVFHPMGRFAVRGANGPEHLRGFAALAVELLRFLCFEAGTRTLAMRLPPVDTVGHLPQVFFQMAPRFYDLGRGLPTLTRAEYAQLLALRESAVHHLQEAYAGDVVAAQALRAELYPTLADPLEPPVSWHGPLALERQLFPQVFWPDAMLDAQGQEVLYPSDNQDLPNRSDLMAVVPTLLIYSMLLLLVNPEGEFVGRQLPASGGAGIGRFAVHFDGFTLLDVRSDAEMMRRCNAVYRLLVPLFRSPVNRALCTVPTNANSGYWYDPWGAGCYFARTNILERFVHTALQGPKVDVPLGVGWPSRRPPAGPGARVPSGTPPTSPGRAAGSIGSQGGGGAASPRSPGSATSPSRVSPIRSTSPISQQPPSVSRAGAVGEIGPGSVPIGRINILGLGKRGRRQKSKVPLEPEFLAWIGTLTLASLEKTAQTEEPIPPELCRALETATPLGQPTSLGRGFGAVTFTRFHGDAVARARAALHNVALVFRGSTRLGSESPAVPILLAGTCVADVILVQPRPTTDLERLSRSRVQRLLSPEVQSAMTQRKTVLYLLLTEEWERMAGLAQELDQLHIVHRKLGLYAFQRFHPANVQNARLYLATLNRPVQSVILPFTNPPVRSVILPFTPTLIWSIISDDYKATQERAERTTPGRTPQDTVQAARRDRILVAHFDRAADLEHKVDRSYLGSDGSTKQVPDSVDVGDFNAYQVRDCLSPWLDREGQLHVVLIAVPGRDPKSHVLHWVSRESWLLTDLADTAEDRQAKHVMERAGYAMFQEAGTTM